MAAKKLFYHVEKHLVESKVNSMWKDFIARKASALDSNPQVVEDYICLQESTEKYRTLLDDYNLGVHRDTKSQISEIAKRVGLKTPDIKNK